MGLSDTKPLPVPMQMSGGTIRSDSRYFRVWHSKTQRNPNNFIAEEVEISTVKAYNHDEAKRRIQNTYKHHVLKVEEIKDLKELEDIKQKLYEKKVEEVA